MFGAWVELARPSLHRRSFKRCGIDTASSSSTHLRSRTPLGGSLEPITEWGAEQAQAPRGTRTGKRGDFPFTRPETRLAMSERRRRRDRSPSLKCWHRCSFCYMPLSNSQERATADPRRYRRCDVITDMTYLPLIPSQVFTNLTLHHRALPPTAASIFTASISRRCGASDAMPHEMKRQELPRVPRTANAPRGHAQESMLRGLRTLAITSTAQADPRARQDVGGRVQELVRAGHQGNRVQRVVGIRGQHALLGPYASPVAPPHRAREGHRLDLQEPLRSMSTCAVHQAAMLGRMVSPAPETTC